MVDAQGPSAIAPRQITADRCSHHDNNRRRGIGPDQRTLHGTVRGPGLHLTPDIRPVLLIGRRGMWDMGERYGRRSGSGLSLQHNRKRLVGARFSLSIIEVS